jgi:hypothetical protein
MVASSPPTIRLREGPVHVTGEDRPLVERLREPLHEALADRSRFYSIRVHGVGRRGEVLIGITGSAGHVPLLFGKEELGPAHVFQVVRETVTRLGI